MANRITNEIKFDDEDAFRRMLEEMRVDGGPLGSFDFNKLLPMPDSLNIECSGRTEKALKLFRSFANETAKLERVCADLPKEEADRLKTRFTRKWDRIKRSDPESWELGEQAYHNVSAYGFPTWYEWRLENWGVKWNAYNCEPLREHSTAVHFDTPWGPVPNIVQLLSARYPEQTIHYRWADEDTGFNVGETVFRAGEVMVSYIPRSGSLEACDMAGDIMSFKFDDDDDELEPSKSEQKVREKAKTKRKAR